MTRKKSILGALFVSALCICASTASNASAMTLHECTENVAGKSTATQFTNSTCTTKGEGKFRTTPIEGNQKVKPTLTETKFTGTTGEVSGTHAVLHIAIAGVSFRITCGKLTSSNSVAENAEEPAGTMVFRGSGKSVFEECKVENPTQCSVPTKLETVELNQTIKQNTGTGEMKVVFKPKEGTTFIIIPVEGASCPEAFKGNKPISGEAVGDVEESTTSINFNSASGNALTFGGVAGAQFTAKIHFSTENGTLLSAETP